MRSLKVPSRREKKVMGPPRLEEGMIASVSVGRVAWSWRTGRVVAMVEKLQKNEG